MKNIEDNSMERTAELTPAESETLLRVRDYMCIGQPKAAECGRSNLLALPMR